MKEAISAAEQNKFSEFSQKVKTSLEDKLRNHPEVQRQANRIIALDTALKNFEAISNINQEV